MVSLSQHNHFYNRAAFGTSSSSTQSSIKFSEIFKKGISNKPLQIVAAPERDYEGMKPSETEVKEAQKKKKQNQVQLNIAWFNQLTDPEAVFREKMTFFWHNHFACRSRNAFLGQQQINTIRINALDKFGDLLMAVSKDAAMLQFLNNQQNRKDSPNENFAREVMELFTLGSGNYTEQDIKSAARAFTGWAYNSATGDFSFRQRQHDFGQKTFRNKTGNFSGEDIIHMILEDKQTAGFVTAKICNFFVGESVDKSIVDELALKFYESEYDIAKLMIDIYSSEWFYNTKFTGNRIKSPIELIAGIQVHTNGVFNNPLNVVYLQKALGQVLLQPPNVGGWPDGKEWIDSSSLTFRMSLPLLLMRNSQNSFQAKDDGDANDGTNAAAKPGQISYSVDWINLSKSLQQSSSAKTVDAVGNYLLSKATTEENRKMITAFAETGKTDSDFLKNAFIGFMSLPEYQLN